MKRKEETNWPASTCYIGSVEKGILIDFRSKTFYDTLMCFIYFLSKVFIQL